MTHRHNLLIALAVVVAAMCAIAAPVSALVFRYGSVNSKISYRTPTEIFGTSQLVPPLIGGNSDTYMMTSTGRVLAQGSGQNGALGDDNAQKYAYNAVAVLLPEGVFVTAVGEAKEVGAAVTSTGHLYTWGRNENGSACQGTTEHDFPTPVEVAGVTEAVAVAGAAKHLLILLAGGRVEVCGTTGTGLGKKIEEVGTPTLIPGLEHVVQVSAGAGTSGARLESGEIRTWGNNQQGEVGNGTTNAAPSPVRISLPGPCLDLSVGGNSNNGHTECLLTENRVEGWGEDEAGEVGDGSETKKLSPTPATEFSSLPGIQEVVASGYNTMVRTESGAMYSLGSGKYQGTLSEKPSFTPQFVAAGVVAISGTARNQVLLKEEVVSDVLTG